MSHLWTYLRTSKTLESRRTSRTLQARQLASSRWEQQPLLVEYLQFVTLQPCGNKVAPSDSLEAKLMLSALLARVPGPSHVKIDVRAEEFLTGRYEEYIFYFEIFNLLPLLKTISSFFSRRELNPRTNAFSTSVFLYSLWVWMKCLSNHEAIVPKQHVDVFMGAVKSIIKNRSAHKAIYYKNRSAHKAISSKIKAKQ